MFRSAITRLTLWYLAIIMLVSLSFSVALYRMGTSEIHADVNRQARRLYENPEFFGQAPAYDLDHDLAASDHRLLLRLGIFNLAVLVLGGGGSYWLARRTLRPIEENMESQNRFTADASHQLRTPLAAMKSEIEVAMREKHLSEDEARHLLTSNLEEIDRLERLSDRLLKLARFNELHSDDMMPVSLNEVINEASAKVATAAKSKSLEIKVPTKPEITVQGEPMSLTELFVAVLENAVKYSPEKSAIGLKLAVKGGDTSVTISDQGPGIPPEDLPHIFDRFYRASQKSRHNGYGLGLAIAKQIAEAHHGSIQAYNLTQGAAFEVHLPLKQPAHLPGLFS